MFALSSCNEDFDIDTIGEDPLMVVYCFPSTSDTTIIQVSVSTPMNQSIRPDLETDISNADISYRVNGYDYPVIAVGHGEYYAIGKHSVNDLVDILVSADSLPSVSGTATIPTDCSIQLNSVKRIQRYDRDSGTTIPQDQIAATFTDVSSAKDYYAFRVKMRSYKGTASAYTLNERGEKVASQYTKIATMEQYLQLKAQHPELEWEFNYTQVVNSYPTLNLEDEPLLHPINKVDDQFGFTNLFYQNFYIVDDATFNGESYTLHLNVPAKLTVGNFKEEYQVEIYYITKDFYKFIKSINDVENNDLAVRGFSLVTPTASNVTGGIGLIGAFNKSESSFKSRNN